jgi:hypothetical protein
MTTNFLEAAGTIGYLSPTKGSGTGNTHSSTTVDTLSFNPQSSNNGASAVVGSLVTIGSGGHAPDIVASIASSASITLVTATSSTVSGTNVSIYNYPVLIGGESSALSNGSAVLSSYWNSNGVIRQSDLQQALQGDVWFVAGGAFTPSAGGYLAGWFLPTYDGGTTFETDGIATPSSTVPAISRSPDFIIPLDNAAYAAGNIRFCQGRYVVAPPPTGFKVKLQNMAGVTMPSTWAVIMAPWAVQY